MTRSQKNIWYGLSRNYEAHGYIQGANLQRDTFHNLADLKDEKEWPRLSSLMLLSHELMVILS